jgi:hypothetical protein
MKAEIEFSEEGIKAAMMELIKIQGLPVGISLGDEQYYFLLVISDAVVKRYIDGAYHQDNDITLNDLSLPELAELISNGIRDKELKRDSVYREIMGLITFGK